MDEFAQFENQLNEYLQDLQQKIETLFKQAIQETVYDYYSPITYERSYTLLNNIKVNIDLNTGCIYVFSDLNEGSPYYSAVDGSPQYGNIAHWIESGHKDSTGIKNQFHQYEGRHYLEKARELIKTEFPDLDIEIIDDGEI